MNKLLKSLVESDIVYILDIIDNEISKVSLEKYNKLKGVIYFNENDLIHVHHGSSRGIVGNIRPESKEGCDFGIGFYTATLKDYALSNIITDKKNGLGYYYNLLVDLSNLSIYDFKDDLRFWALYTAYNRGVITNIIQYPKLFSMITTLEDYDIVKGLIADDRSAYAFGRFLGNSMTDICLLECLKYFDLGYQYVFKTQKACEKILEIENIVVSGEYYNNISSDKSRRLNETKKVVDDLEEKYEGVGKTFRKLIKEYI